MILLQLSAGQGPVECSQAVGLALKEIEKQCREKGIKLDIVEAIEMKERGCFKSALLQLDSSQNALAKQLAESWQGAMLWVCQSQFRPKHKRKNWFFSGQMYEINETQLDKGVTFQTCRASGAGGQHVNTTDSAVRATHTETGI
jgi:peptide chain release factor